MARLDRKTAYLVLMGSCIGLLVLAWGVVRHVSVPVALVLTAVAAVLPPIAAVVANYGILRGTRRLDFEELPPPVPPRRQARAARRAARRPGSAPAAPGEPVFNEDHPDWPGSAS